MPQQLSPAEVLANLQRLRNSSAYTNADNPEGEVQGRLQRERHAEQLRLRGDPYSERRADMLQQSLDTEDASVAPLRQRAADITRQEQGFEDYQRPGAVAGRQDALQRLLAPVQMRGEYAVKAAEAAAGGRADVNQQKIEAQTARDAANNTAREQHLMTRESGLSSRAAAATRSQERQKRIMGLQSGKAHAARPSGIMSWLTGPSEKAADQAEIARLMAEGEGAEAAGTIEMVDPRDGAILDVPVDQVAAAEAAGARRR